MMCWHKWSRWADVGRNRVGCVLIQEKRCDKCGKARRRQTMWLVEAEEITRLARPANSERADHG